jgi:hypothetical protein
MDECINIGQTPNPPEVDNNQVIMTDSFKGRENIDQ